MLLYKAICYFYEHTSGIASMYVRDGDVRVNGKVTKDDKLEVQDGDVIDICGDKVKVKIPSYFKGSSKK